MKQWSLQDIRPVTPGRGRSSDRLRASDIQERPRSPREVPDDVEDIDIDNSSERVREDVRRPSRDMDDERGIPARVGQPLRKKMSLAPSPFRKYVKIGAGIALLGTVVVVSFLHSTATATITIIPKIVHKDIQTELAASGDGSAALPFAVVSQELQASTVIPAKGVEEVSEAAHGTITLYNEYSTKAYTLVKNTRVEADGKVFRIQESVSVPGYTTKDGVTLPGSVQATVRAVEVGEAGNIAPTQFTLPGLKDTGDEYLKIYARSTSAFSGGIVGKRAVVDENDIATARAAMEEKLAEQLRAHIAEQQVAEQIMYVSAAVITYTDAVSAISDNEQQANYVVYGTISAPVFDAEMFATAVAGSVNEASAGVSYRLLHPEALTFAYTSETTTLDERTPINFSISGSAALVAQISRDEFSESLVGISKDEVHSIVANYPAIDRITYTISVPWKRSFPENPDRVTLDIVIPE